MSLIARMNTFVTLNRATTAKSGGAAKRTYSVVNSVSNEPCDIQPATSSVVWRFMTKNLSISHTIFFLRDIGATDHDYFTATDAAGNTRYFLIQPGGYQPPPPGYRGKWPAMAHVEELPQAPTAVV